MRWLKKVWRNPFWFIITLPFNLIFQLGGWLLSYKRLTSDGYVLKRLKTGKDQYEHREIAEEIMGRRLESWEVVHHINGRRNDNRPSNLCIMDRNAHDSYHKWYDSIFETYGKYPKRTTQLKKLRENFSGIFLSDYDDKKTEAG